MWWRWGNDWKGECRNRASHLPRRNPLTVTANSGNRRGKLSDHQRHQRPERRQTWGGGARLYIAQPSLIASSRTRRPSKENQSFEPCGQQISQWLPGDFFQGRAYFSHCHLVLVRGSYGLAYQSTVTKGHSFATSC